jgi:hypothetical protein
MRTRLLLIALALAVPLAAAGCGDDDSDGESAGTFTAMAQGVSTGTDLPNGEAELNITLEFIDAPYSLRDLKVNKVLDVRTEPPWRVHDGTYTLTAADGDTLTLVAEGSATAPGSGPDPFFSGADEDYVVESGTGRFEGAEGDGKIISAVALDALGTNPDRSAVVKYFTGTVELQEGE